MAQKTMYSAVNNSIQATLTASIAATDTIIPLSSVSYLPAAPNLVTIGTDDDAEVIRYNGIDGLTLTGCERGFDGTTAKVWLVNEVVYRAYTHYDHETFKSNIEDLDTDKLAKTGDGSSTTVSFTAATQRTALATNSKLSVLFGLLSKWLTDLKGLAFKDKVTSSDFEDNAVSNSALAQMAAKTIKGNATDEAAPPTDLSASDVRSLLNVSDGADATATEIAGASTASSMADSDTIPIVSGEEIKRVTPSVLKTKLGSDLPTGGTVGQALVKSGTEDYEAAWQDISAGAEQHYATLAVASWYQQSADSSDEYWFACDVALTDFNSSTQDILVYAADSDSFDWLSENAFYELSITSSAFSVQAKEAPTAAINIFYMILTRSD